MEEPHRARERQLAEAQQQHLPLHPAQIRELSPCAEPGAIDDVAPAEEGARYLDAEADRGPELVEPRGERRERRARVEVRLFGEVEPVTEAPGEVGLEGRNGLGTDALEVAGAAGKLGDLGGVAAMRHDQRAVHHGARKALLPPGDAFRAELRNEGPRALELAPGREHPPRVPRAAGGPEPRPALEHLDRDAPLGELQRAREARDAGSDDAHPHGVSRPWCQPSPGAGT